MYLGANQFSISIFDCRIKRCVPCVALIWIIQFFHKLYTQLDILRELDANPFEYKDSGVEGVYPLALEIVDPDLEGASEIEVEWCQNW